MENEHDAELHDWRFVAVKGGKLIILEGHIFADSKGRFQDGQLVSTSSITKMDGNVVHTRNTVYLLKEDE